MHQNDLMHKIMTNQDGSKVQTMMLMYENIHVNRIYTRQNAVTGNACSYGTDMCCTNELIKVCNVHDDDDYFYYYLYTGMCNGN
jgi:hypothetical protein